jgi:murein L,D-transpeptidase YafK
MNRIGSTIRVSHFLKRMVAIPLLAAAGCTVQSSLPTSTPELKQSLAVEEVLKSKNMKKSSPIMMRIFKEEGVLEVWKRVDSGKYELASSYDICVWSGKLGPKYAEGDRQAPEGFYSVSPGQMNPNSQYHLAFNIGFPNTYDRVNGRYGQYLMVHGACSSAGCYSMNDDQIEEIYAYARDAFRGGQKSFQLQAFPFRMTERNMARYKNDPNINFWTMIKDGYDAFEATRTPPKVDVCEKRYAFNLKDTPLSPTATCPTGRPTKAISAYTSPESTKTTIFSSLKELDTSTAALKPSISGIEEAAIVADWSKRRAKGIKVTPQPPAMTEVTQEQIAAALAPVKQVSNRIMASAIRPALIATPAPMSVPDQSMPRRF